MKRREFIAAFGVAATAWPLAARAQQPAVPVIGFLRSSSLADSTHLVKGFRQGLSEAGFVEGQNIAIDYRYADNQHDRLPALAADLIKRGVAVIVGNTISALAAKSATATVPIVFATGGDPVRDGLVAALNRPGGNVTGIVFISGVLGAKRLQLLHQLLARPATIAMLVNPGMSETEAERSEVQAAAQTIGQQLLILDVNSASDIDAAFAALVRQGVGAVLVGSAAFLTSQRKRVIALATRHAMPTIFPVREPVDEGGLMSYGASITDAYRQAGVYAGRILKGQVPADLPVVQSTKFEFVINLKAAKALGLDLPPTLLSAADEVIE